MKNSRNLLKTLAVALLAGAGLSGCIAVPVHGGGYGYGYGAGHAPSSAYRPYYRDRGDRGYRGGYDGGRYGGG
jgi:hypothetical protein